MSLNELISKQIAYANLINKSIINFKKTSLVKRTRSLAEARLSAVEKLWEEYSSTHCEIEILSLKITSEERAAHDYLENDQYTAQEEKYFEYVATLRDLINNEQLNNALANTSLETRLVNNNLQLPKITLPTFSGSYDTWTSFHDLFVALVHDNSSISLAQKLQYLKSSVSGEAEQLLKHYKISDINYEVAWKVLLQRYHNPRVLVKEQLKILCSQTLISSESAKALKTLLDVTTGCISGLENLGVSTKGWDPILIHLISQKLPCETQTLWESILNRENELPTFERFKTFLEERFRTLESIPSIKVHNVNKHDKLLPIQLKQTYSHNSYSAIICVVCKKNHNLYQCSNFKDFDIQSRIKLAKSKHLCLNCLSNRHQTLQCLSKRRCYHCGKMHHSLLHIKTKVEQDKSTLHSDAKNQNTFVNTKTTKHSSSTNLNKEVIPSFYSHTFNQQALLATALVNVQSTSGERYTLRALIDSGSQVSFITSVAASRLKLKKRSTSLKITGVNNSKATNVKQKAILSLRSCSNGVDNMYIQVLIIPTITDFIPPHTIDCNKWSHIAGLHLADPTFSKPGKIDLLLGADVYSNIILEGIRKGPAGTPIAQNSVLGWILFGSTHDTSNAQVISLPVQISNKNEDCLDQLLRKFWETEQIPEISKLSQNEQECEDFYNQTFLRLPNGRYEVRLPFLNNQTPDLGNSRSMALRRFYNLENRLLRDQVLNTEYKACINEYIKMGHMKEVTHEAPFDKTYYIPHHAVFKDSSTTKVRIVFDASALSSNGKSLNDQLYSGPKLQSNLFSIILRWRRHQYAMSADIEKMYRMINVNKHDQYFQRILWRNHPGEPIKDYALTTVTFGIKPSPYLAIRTLHQLAKDGEHSHPLASSVILKDFYVDDAITGASSVDLALESQTQLISLLNSAGFRLRKWVSNNPKLLINIPEEHREKKFPLTFTDDESIKALGIQWYPSTDILKIQSPVLENDLCTKRAILSNIAKLFDPLGWISPVIITAKILMQKLWASGCSWDEPIPETLANEWETYKSTLHHIHDIQIPRWIHCNPSNQNSQLHGFSDASNYAYSAAVYLRVQDENGRTHVSLLTAKSKVAPIKPITLPRLELNGAVLLSKLLLQTKNDLELHNTPLFAWTDSTITLSWIRSDPRKYKSYIANRIATIQDTISNSSWNHIRSSDNPADCNSRGVQPSLMSNLHIWWNGPSWLSNPRDQWPKPVNINLNSNDAERKRLTFNTFSNDFALNLFQTFSTYYRMLRVISYCFRFYNNLQLKGSTRKGGFLTSKELQSSKFRVLKLAQNFDYYTEINDLNHDRVINSKSPLCSLNPFLDSDGILRIGGRLIHSSLIYKTKHAIILPKSSNHLTLLIIRHFHHQTLHGGVELTLSALRDEFWLVHGRRSVRKVIHKCITCFKSKPSTENQLMGNLPSCRTACARAFLHTGVDYAGPINIKMSKHRGNRLYKGYICLFICMTTKAIHLEPVSDLTSQAFLAAFKRFISRRGLCTDVYSDNGTNFVGAKRLLDKDLKAAIKTATIYAAEYVANKGITWHFNPPSAPHFGGLWEAGIKSVKYHLKRVISDTSLTFEELATVLTQIEGCLNSRPLCRLSEDPNDDRILTPGHFLIGSAILSIPEGQYNSITHLGSRWNYLRQLQQHFWQRWSKEYLLQLQNRPKWKTKKINLKIGDIVLLKEDNIPSYEWPLGKIIQIHPNKDGLVRVVTVKTQKNTLVRPIHKLCLLPISDNVATNVLEF